MTKKRAKKERPTPGELLHAGLLELLGNDKKKFASWEEYCEATRAALDRAPALLARRRPLTWEERRAIAEEIEPLLRRYPDVLRWAMELVPETAKEAIRRTKLGRRAARSQEIIDIVTSEYEYMRGTEWEKSGREPKKEVLYIEVASQLNATGWEQRFGEPINPRVVRRIMSESKKANGNKAKR